MKKCRRSADELFAVNYTFNTLDDAQVYVDARLLKLNENSLILEERQYLAYRPPLELADIGTAKVDRRRSSALTR